MVSSRPGDAILEGRDEGTFRFRGHGGRPMRMLPIALTLAALTVAGALPAAAGERSSATDEATRDILEGMERLRDGVSRLIDSLPRYSLPEITENGDIVIRRLDPGRDGKERHEETPGGIRI
jgi:hypothetical protein